MSKIQVRRDTAAAWTAANPVLLSGEPALETDTRKEKIGDGVTAWRTLPYRGGGVTAEQLAEVRAIAEGAASVANLLMALMQAGGIGAVLMRTAAAPNPAIPANLPAGARVWFIGTAAAVTGDSTTMRSGDLSSLV